MIEYLPLVHKAIDLSDHKPSGLLFIRVPKFRDWERRDIDVLWSDLLQGVEPAECVPVKSTDPLYVLYTSGTTGQPKGVIRDNGGHAVALSWTMKNLFYDVDPGKAFWAASDVGWVAGHSYIVYAPLDSRGHVDPVFEGKPVGTPDPVRSGGSLPTMMSRFCSPHRRPSAPSNSRIRTGHSYRSTTCRSSVSFSWLVNALIRRPSSGRRSN